MKILKWTYAFKSYASSFIVEILNFCNPELQLKDPESSQDIKFSVKIRDIHKVGKKNSIGISVFGYENKEKHSIYVSKKCCEEKHVDLLLLEEKGKRHYVLIKYFNIFMYDHTLHCGRKHFCCYCLQAFSTEEILKHMKDYFKINGRKRIIMPKKGEYIEKLWKKNKLTIYNLWRFWKYFSARRKWKPKSKIQNVGASCYFLYNKIIYPN